METEQVVAQWSPIVTPESEDTINIELVTVTPEMYDDMVIEQHQQSGGACVSIAGDGQGRIYSIAIIGVSKWFDPDWAES